MGVSIPSSQKLSAGTFTCQFDAQKALSICTKCPSMSSTHFERSNSLFKPDYCDQSQ